MKSASRLRILAMMGGEEGFRAFEAEVETGLVEGLYDPIDMAGLFNLTEELVGRSPSPYARALVWRVQIDEITLYGVRRRDRPIAMSNFCAPL